MELDERGQNPSWKAFGVVFLRSFVFFCGQKSESRIQGSHDRAHDSMEAQTFEDKQLARQHELALQSGQGYRNTVIPPVWSTRISRACAGIGVEVRAPPGQRISSIAPGPGIGRTCTALSWDQ